MSSGRKFDPSSDDAVIQDIINRISEQDRVTVRNHTELRGLMLETRDQAMLTNGRVRSLEKFRYTVWGALLAIVTIIGWYVTMHGK